MAIQKKSLVGKTAPKSTTTKTSAAASPKMETTSKLKSLKGGFVTLKKVGQ